MKDIPLTEITLRKYEKPLNLEKRELIRKICLSLGLLQLGDSRDIIVDVLMTLINANKERKKMDSETIRTNVEILRKKYSLSLKGLAESNIRRQLKRLRDFGLIEKTENKYSLLEHLSIKEIFQNNIEKFILPQILQRINEYLEELEKG